MGACSDRELVERARTGDGAATGELFSRYWRAARAAAYGVTGEVASAEDAASEAFRQALTGLDSLQDAERFGAWLRTIVIRKAHAERERRSTDAAEHEPIDPAETAEATVERAEAHALVQHAVRDLPEA